MVGSFSPKERGKAHAEEHGLTLDECLVELLGHTLRLGGVMDVQMTNSPGIIKVSIEFLAQELPSCYSLDMLCLPHYSEPLPMPHSTYRAQKPRI